MAGRLCWSQVRSCGTARAAAGPDIGSAPPDSVSSRQIHRKHFVSYQSLSFEFALNSHKMQFPLRVFIANPTKLR
jgi:hypothetical protein